jgi:CheY-like chemotaxis protein
MNARTTSLDGLRILVGEDEYLVARDLERTLLDAGCAQVMLAPSIADCEHVRAHTALDATVLDLRLRDGDAGDFARTLRADGTPVLFITGYDESTIPEDLADVPLLAKPFQRPQLLDRLKEVLAARPSAEGPRP